MNEPKQNRPRVMLRGKAAGGITASDVERRARELAMIRGNGEQPTEEDRADAERELFTSDADPAISTADAVSLLSASRDPSEPSASQGTQSAVTEHETDESTAAERLALQGVDEAQHDQMIAAQRSDRRKKS